MEPKPAALALALLACAAAAAPPKDAAALEWVRMPGGSFVMGSGFRDEGPKHAVALEPFWIAKTLVTRRQYRACEDAGACAPVPGCGVPKDDDAPVVCVTWEQARAFARWAGGALPSEAQWEYAARGGGKDVKYPWGDAEPSCERALILQCGFAPERVCSRPKGNTPQGLCDMAGNAWQWMEDAYAPNYGAPPAEGFRALRGGVWSYGFPTDARATRRFWSAPDKFSAAIGFRPVRTTAP